MKTIQSVINEIINNLQKVVVNDTVDRFIAGDPLSEVTGIVTTFTATMDVIKKTSEIGANLIITHEPTFYDHMDETSWLSKNATYSIKCKLIDEKKIVIWRFHDLLHYQKPDGIYVGMVKELGWNDYVDQDFYSISNIPSVFNIPKIKLCELATCMKNNFRMQGIRIVGNPDMECKRIGLFVGSGPGYDQVKFINDLNLDVFVCGETVEWQTCEYVRDGASSNLNKAMIVLGHANSEEAGMKYLVDWLKTFILNVPITYIKAGDPFIYL